MRYLVVGFCPHTARTACRGFPGPQPPFIPILRPRPVPLPNPESQASFHPSPHTHHHRHPIPASATPPPSVYRRGAWPGKRAVGNPVGQPDPAPTPKGTLFTVLRGGTSPCTHLSSRSSEPNCPPKDRDLPYRASFLVKIASLRRTCAKLGNVAGLTAEIHPFSGRVRAGARAGQTFPRGTGGNASPILIPGRSPSPGSMLPIGLGDVPRLWLHCRHGLPLDQPTYGVGVGMGRSAEGRAVRPARHTRPHSPFRCTPQPTLLPRCERITVGSGYLANAVCKTFL